MKIKVSLESAGCHNTCKHCLWSQGGPSKDFLQVDEILSIREMIASLGAPFDFGFSNGHMIHSGWRILWPIMYEEVCCGQINGCRMVEDPDYRTTIAEMREMGLRRVQLTFYGLEDTHNRFANSKDAFAYDVGAARRFVECGVPVEQVQIVCHRDNVHEVDGIIQFAKTLQGKDVLTGGELMFPGLSGRWIRNQSLRVTREQYAGLSGEARSLRHWQDLKMEADWVNEVRNGALIPSAWMQERISRREQEVRLYIDRHLTVWDNSDPSLRKRLGTVEEDGLDGATEEYQRWVDPAWRAFAEMDDMRIVEDCAMPADTALNTRSDVLILWLTRCRARSEELKAP